MKTSSLPCIGAVRAIVVAALFGIHGLVGAASLADQPVFATSNVPGNLALALSVEWPTASRTAHVGNYTSASTYLGYFDPNKCYTYVVDTTPNPLVPNNDASKGDSSYFNPTGVAAAHKCTGANDAMWSGNFLNWAATATIDPFRWAMTGGRRVVDEVGNTILEKGWHSGQGLFGARDLTVSEIPGATPYNNASKVNIVINGRGFAMRIATTGGGMKGEYFNNMTLSGPAERTVDNDSVDHDWGDGRPVTGVNVNNFSARYTGSFVAPESGSYTFRVRADDGVRLFVTSGGSTLATINQWKDQGPTAYEVSANLNAGQPFEVKIEYYESAVGAVMQFTWRRPSSGSFVAFTDDISAAGTTDYTMRTKVCDPSAPGGVESNCVKYGSNYKPEGLIQQYSKRMRFSAFGYLNDASDQRDGGVMRARQKFVGPSQPVPGLPDTTNSAKEWSETTGIFVRNPNAADAATTTTATGITISDSGVINYLNKFGQLLPGDYKSHDPVSEMYYAVLRYYKNLGNIPAWSNLGTNDTATKKTRLDGFPVITDWDDPVQYSCQRNFVLGIGDIYTHVDKNVPGNSEFRYREPAIPSGFSTDTVNAVTATNKVGALQGVGTIGNRNSYSGRDNSAYIAGLAYDSNTRDIRPDVAGQTQTIGKQTVQTYWVDVLEQAFQANNQFYLAAKFGGLNVPADFDPYNFTGTIPQTWWSTSGETLTDTRGDGTTQPRPDNYFTAGRPDTMVDGLTRAFASIANAIKAFTTSFSLSTVQVSSSGAASYASQYDSNGWSGVLTASQIAFATDGTPSSTPVWSTTTTFENQLAGAGWNTGRRIVTWNGSAGVPFRAADLAAGQTAALDTPWDAAEDSTNYVNYLRGDRSREKTTTNSTRPYRQRLSLLGDIVNAKVTPVAPPSMRYSESINPGYANFKTTWAARPTMVYVGANDGMLHAFNGALSGASAGTEQFAYVPSALYAGPSSPTTPTLNGLAQLGNPNYEHRYYVDATPLAFDIDFNNTVGTFSSTSAASSDWRTVVIGGLGKGGKSFYAIDVTNPAGMTTEAIVKDKVLWEFSDTTMGFSFGAPNVIKTKKYGWVVVFTSGYNNSDGYGYIYFVNPRTGLLLEKVRTATASAGLAQATAYIKDFSDGTADAIYAGDLNGQLWRFDVTAERSTMGTPYPAPLKMATLMDANGDPQPITLQPLVEIDPKSRKRYVMFGTGQLLDTIDINSSAAQAFYAIIDGTASGFGDASALPSGASYPLTRSNLTAVSNADLISGTANDFVNKVGWYIELGTTSNIGWRAVSNPTSYNGIVAFASLLTTGNACSPSGQSRIYAVHFGAGKSALTPEGTQAFVGNPAAITDLKFLGVDSKVRLIAGDVQGALRNVGVPPGSGSSVRLLNWREVPTVD